MRDMDDPHQVRPQPSQDSPASPPPDPSMPVAADDPNAFAYIPPTTTAPSLDGRIILSINDEGQDERQSSSDEVQTPAATPVSHSPERMAGSYTPEQPTSSPEMVSYIEHTEPEISPELSEFIQKEEAQHEAIDLPIVIHNQSQPSGPPKLQLPLSKAAAQEGLGKGVGSSFRWLSEWCYRMFKKVSGNVVFVEDNPKPPQV